MEALHALPDEIVRLLERDVPVFGHLAAAGKDRPPVSCRVYAVRMIAGSARLWASVSSKQSARIRERTQYGSSAHFALLLTSGVDNEAYQIKGEFASFRPLADEDAALLARQQELTGRTFPHLLPLLACSPEECTAVCLQPAAVYTQTPGPLAGVLLAGRSERP